jgi:hypothetical protein
MDENTRRALPILFAVAGALLTVWALVAGAFDSPNVGGWIFEYQTLIAGLLAVAGAGLTVFVVRHQIAAGQRQFQHQMRVTTSKERAAIDRTTGYSIAALKQLIQNIDRISIDRLGGNHLRATGRKRGVLHAPRSISRHINSDEFEQVRSHLNGVQTADPRAFLDQASVFDRLANDLDADELEHHLPDQELTYIRENAVCALNAIEHLQQEVRGWTFEFPN